MITTIWKDKIIHLVSNEYKLGSDIKLELVSDDELRFHNDEITISMSEVELTILLKRALHLPGMLKGSWCEEDLFELKPKVAEYNSTRHEEATRDLI